MSKAGIETLPSSEVEALLRRDLAQGDRVLAGVAPVLRHLLTGSGQTLVSDDILARMRGMLGDLADQLLASQAEASENDAGEFASMIDALAERLAADTAVLGHCYAIAVEAQIATELEGRSGVDQVLPPLMQELIASDETKSAELAMATMAAQARFLQAQRRMGLPLADLPAELFHDVLRSWSHFAKDSPAAERTKGEALLRAQYDESTSRIGLLGRLVSSLGSAAPAALRIEHAGFALFVTALAQLSGQPRELAILSCHPSQASRLAIGLRASGLKPEEVLEQFMTLHPEFALPQEFAGLGKDEARSLLDSSVLGEGAA